MAKRRRKAKDKSAKEEAEKSKRFMWILVGIFVLFIVGYGVLRWYLA